MPNQGFQLNTLIRVLTLAFAFVGAASLPNLQVVDQTNNWAGD